MTRAVGRDQLVPMERLIRILICLADAGKWGVPVDKLLRVADLDEDTKATRAQLRRDLMLLRQGGWDIDNVAAEGSEGRYVLRIRLNRVAVLLTPGERAELRQLLDRPDVDRGAPPPFLGLLAHAVADRCVVSFLHGGHRHRVHPDDLFAVQSGWVLVGRHTETLVSAEYVTAWMSAIDLDEPGTALPRPAPADQRLDPTHWELDPPITVTLSAAPEFVPDVLRLLPGATVRSQDGNQVTIEVEVTNRAAFRTRLFVLGLRVRVVGPPAYRSEIIDNLRAVMEAGDGALR